MISDTTVERKSETVENKESINEICTILKNKKYCYLPADKVKALLAIKGSNSLNDWNDFKESWGDLVIDQYMADGGTYRKRRHATLSALSSSTDWSIEPHQPHYQTVHYNNLNGGIARHYKPILKMIINNVFFKNIITLGCEVFARLSPSDSWHIEVHQFRINANTKQKGEPTPEGVHRDGVSFVMVLMINRENIDSGTTCIYDLNKNKVEEFTMKTPLSMALFDDENVFHGVTPVKPLNLSEKATRDVLVVTFKKKVTVGVY